MLAYTYTWTVCTCVGGVPSAGVACGGQAFRQMSLKLHPDKQRGTGTAAAAARFSEVRAAYDLLQDAERRALYDMHGMEAVDDGQPRRAALHGGCSPGHTRLQPGYTGLQPALVRLQAARRGLPHGAVGEPA